MSRESKRDWLRVFTPLNSLHLTPSPLKIGQVALKVSICQLTLWFTLSQRTNVNCLPLGKRIGEFSPSCETNASETQPEIARVVLTFIMAFITQLTVVCHTRFHIFRYSNLSLANVQHWPLPRSVLQSPYWSLWILMLRCGCLWHNVHNIICELPRSTI